MIIGKKVEPFTLQAFVDCEFKEITERNLTGKWAVFFFYPADFTFV